MSSMRPVSVVFLLGVCLGGLSACTSVLLNTPVTKRADGWVLTLGEVKQGPNEYVGEAVTMTPGSGENLVWAVLTVKNEGATEQPFSYEACTLGEKDRGTAPVVVARHPEVALAVDRSEDFTPGQERVRQLIYKYPEEQRPTRVRCGNIVLPIPAAR